VAAGEPALEAYDLWNDGLSALLRGSSAAGFGAVCPFCLVHLVTLKEHHIIKSLVV
jgi:hypothetical protein